MQYEEFLNIHLNLLHLKQMQYEECNIFVDKRGAKQLIPLINQF